MTIVLSNKISMILSINSNNFINIIIKNNENSFQVNNKLLKSCKCTTKWEIINPGIILAHCLQRVFNISVINSLDFINYERFNVYGPKRSYFHDFDEWYVTGKQTILQPNSSLIMSNYPISFHYISEIETNLLYKIIYKLIQPTFIEFQLLWPHNNKEGGHYSNWLFKNQTEMKSFYNHLMNNISVLNTNCM